MTMMMVVLVVPLWGGRGAVWACTAAYMAVVDVICAACSRLRLFQWMSRGTGGGAFLQLFVQNNLILCLRRL